MGFGLLFIGYFIAALMSINVVGSLIAMIGYCIIFLASGKLSKYNNSFNLVRIGAVVMVLFWLVMSASTLSEFLANELMIPKDIFGPTFDSVMGHSEMALFFIFNSAVLYSIRSIANDTEDTKIAISSVRNFIFICVGLLAYVIYFVVVGFSSSQLALAILNGTAIIIRFVCIVFNLILIFSCYMRICDENDVDMNRKPSRFAFINTMRQRFDEKQERAAQQQADYMRERAQKKKNKMK